MTRTAGWIGAALCCGALAAARAETPGCDELLQQAEAFWIKLDYDRSDQQLEKARALCPDRAELYWRLARDEYDRIELIPRDRKPPAAERVKRYTAVEHLADRCLALEGQNAECWLWKSIAIGRRGSTQGVLQSLFEVDDLERALLQTQKLGPRYRSANGAANSQGDVESMLGMFYRALPEWTCSFPFRTLIGTCGDLDRSVAYQRRAVAIEPARIEYHKELALSLLCRGQARGRPEDIEEATRIFTALQSLPEFKATDPMDKEHARMVLADPSLACGYSRDAQQEQSRDALQGAAPKP